MPVFTESSGGVPREGASAAGDGGPGSEGFGEDFRRGADPHSGRHEAATRVLVGPLQHESQSSQVAARSGQESLVFSACGDGLTAAACLLAAGSVFSLCEKWYQ